MRAWGCYQPCFSMRAARLTQLMLDEGFLSHRHNHDSRLGRISRDCGSPLAPLHRVTLHQLWKLGGVLPLCPQGSCTAPRLLLLHSMCRVPFIGKEPEYRQRQGQTDSRAVRRQPRVASQHWKHKEEKKKYPAAAFELRATAEPSAAHAT